LRNNVPDAYKPPSHGYQKKKSLYAKNRRIRLQDFSGSESSLFGIQTKIQELSGQKKKYSAAASKCVIPRYSKLKPPSS
jgi:hypothetical protein